MAQPFRIGEGATPVGLDRRSYDLWKFYRDGRFYTLLSLFEDERVPGMLFFEARITDKFVTELR